MALSPAVSSRLRQLRKRADQAKFTGKPPSALLYTGVGMIALLKDLLDLAIGLIPGLVTVIALCLTFLIWMLLFLFDRSSARTNKKMVQGIILLGVALFEGVAFGLNYLPLETMSIVLLYILANRAYKRAQKEGEREGIKENKRLIEEARAYEALEMARAREEEAANDERYEAERRVV